MKIYVVLIYSPRGSTMDSAYLSSEEAIHRMKEINKREPVGFFAYVDNGILHDCAPETSGPEADPRQLIIPGAE